MFCSILTVHVLFYRFWAERFVNRTMDLFGGGEDTGPYHIPDGGAL